MIFFKKKTKQRRIEVRKGIPSDGSMFWARFRESGGLGSLPIAVSLLAIILLVDLVPLDPIPYRVGQYVPSAIRSRVGFKVLSPKLLEQQMERAVSETPAIFKIDEGRIDQIVLPLKAIPGQLQAASQPQDLDQALQKRFDLRPEDIEEWKKFADEKGSQSLTDQLDGLAKKLLETCITSAGDADIQFNRRGSAILLQNNSQNRRIRKTQLISLSDSGRIQAAIGDMITVMDQPLRYNVSTWLKKHLTDSPLYTYDAITTEADLKAAETSVRNNPPIEAYDRYPAGETLVSRQEGQETKPLDQKELELLKYEHSNWVVQQSSAKIFAKILGRAILVLLVCAAIFIYIYNAQPRVVSNHWRGSVLSVVLVLTLLAGKTLVQWIGCDPSASVGVILALSMILIITYNRPMAMVLASAMSVLMVMVLRADFTLLIILIAAVTTSVALLNDIRTRSRLIEISAMSALVVFMIVWARSLAGGVPTNFTVRQGLWAVGFSLLAGFFVQGVLPLVEQVFRVATSMTLLEWCDANKPLLRRLAMEAPGTYNHSLQLGTMCEAAAETIGARGLLARVGAYYHDIGKMNKPEYFIENQGGQTSKHAKLSPAMSLLIIIGHVKDGLAMAREYKLPTVLQEFIATHHGTTLVQYFYQQAAQQRKQADQRAPDEVEFRYPGPKPMSKEAAILMLADASESSVRSMESPTPGQIENQVHTMVSRRLMDGQMDNCELTLREVHQIETSLVKSICGIYHSRIAYPTPPGQKPSAAEMKKNDSKAGDSTVAGIPSGSVKAEHEKPDDTTR